MRIGTHIFYSALGWAVFAPRALAQGVIVNDGFKNAVNEADIGLSTQTPEQTAASIISAFLGILAILALALILYAGFTWMTAAGDEQKVTKAKDTLRSATIGLIIILASYGIALYVFGLIEGATGV